MTNLEVKKAMLQKNERNDNEKYVSTDHEESKQTKMGVVTDDSLEASIRAGNFTFFVL